MEHFSFKGGTVAFYTVFFRDHRTVAVLPPESLVCFSVLNVEAYFAHFDKMLWRSQLPVLGFSGVFLREREICTLPRASPEAEAGALTRQELGADGGPAVAVAEWSDGAWEGRKEGDIPQDAEKTRWVQRRL